MLLSQINLKFKLLHVILVVYERAKRRASERAHTHTHTDTQIIGLF